MDIVGTPYYIAPEVLDGTYGKQCDVWSLGVVLYQMLTGMMPFDGDSQSEVFSKIKSGSFIYPDKVKVSEPAQDLINRMLTVDPNKRITVEEIMVHHWFD